MKDLISVIIPAYNSEKHIARCLDSILTQSYENIEVIAVNDGSVDSTGDIIRAYAEKDGRVIPVNQENSGAAAARAKGISLVKGDYFTFVDSDDYIEKEMLEVLLGIIRSGDYQISCCKKNNVSENTSAKRPEADSSVREFDFTGIMRNMYNEEFWSVWGKLYKRELLENNSLLLEDLAVGEDLLLAYSLYRKCSRVAVTDMKLYNYYRHSGSVMAQALNEKHIRDSMRSYETVAQDMDKSSDAYIYHIQNLISNDFGFLNRIVLKNTCRGCYGELRAEILKYKKYAFINRENKVLNNRHRLGIFLLHCCPPLFNLSIKIKG